MRSSWRRVLLAWDLTALTAACATAPVYTARISGTPGLIYSAVVTEAAGTAAASRSVDGSLPTDSAAAARGMTIPLSGAYVSVMAIKKTSGGLLAVDVFRNGALIGHAQTGSYFGIASVSGQ